MNSTLLQRASLSLAIAIAFLPAVGRADDAAPRLLATDAGVEINPAMDAPAWQVRVSGPDGKIFEDTRIGNERLLVSPKLLGYASWKDGSYHFELVPVLGDRQRGGSESAQAPATSTSASLAIGGTFLVQRGVVHLPGKAREGTAADGGKVAATGDVQPADVVHADDVIIDGSLCIGFDCIDGEVFNFDTVRLKENNTRIAFLDTSVGEFPSNDWTIVANDSANGGASFLGFEDVTGAKFPFMVIAGAPTNSLFVSAAGNIGIGTGVPVLDLHMTTTNTPGLRLEQTGAGGFTPQTWDVAGNEANFFVRDVTGGSRLPLRIRPGAPTSSLDIAASGNVGFGTASPAVALHASRAGNTVLRLTNTTGLAQSWEFNASAVSGRLNISDDTTQARVPLKLAPGATNNLLRIGMPAAGTVEVNGTLKVNGNIQVSGSVGPDYVFAPGFPLPSIEEHADFMATNRHLPKVGPAKVDDEGNGLMDLGTLSHGMLEELEYAHLYIADLDRTVDTLQQRLDERDAQVRSLLEEVQAIRAQLDAQ